MSGSGRPAPTHVRLDNTRPRPASYTRLATADSCLVLGVVTFLAGVAGMFDDTGDAMVLVGFGAVTAVAAGIAKRSMDRRDLPSPGRVLSGLAISWTVVVICGAGLYLVTGTIDSVHAAVVESAAGFSTTSVTTLDPSGLSLPMQFFRAGTQWLGGLIGIIVGVVSMPIVLRGTLMSVSKVASADRLVPTPIIGRQRILKVYASLTLALGVAFALAGLGTRDSIVHAMTTISTGGFSSHADSFVTFGAAPRLVAGVGMAIGGASYFAIWWAIKGRLRPLWRSTEMRLYIGLIVAGTLLVWLSSDGLSHGESAFTAISAISTTGFAIGDWTLLDDSVLMILLILIGTGSMSGSAGGGLRVVRAWTLVGFASRELRRHLDPNAVVVIKQDGASVDETTLERTTGYQVAHLGLCGVAAFLLAATGLDLIGAIFTGISVLSTYGPGLGTNAFGSLDALSPEARLTLVPFMLAGRLSILPLLLAVSAVFRLKETGFRQVRRLGRWRGSR